VPKTVPTAPTACKASGFEVTKKWVNFQWQAPSSNGGASITWYVIKVPVP
jgi:hypothetical protein